MKWSILICSIFERSKDLEKLLTVLYPQIAPYQDVEVIISSDNCQKSIGKKRQELLEASRGDFVSFIDDDDLVDSDYVKEILPHLYYNDYIGFKLQSYVQGRPDKITIHDANIDGWYEDDEAYYRDFSHINPIRKSIALEAEFHGGRAEDNRWANEIRQYKHLIKHSRFIDKVLYFYYYDPSKTTQPRMK